MCCRNIAADLQRSRLKPALGVVLWGKLEELRLKCLNANIAPYGLLGVGNSAIFLQPDFVNFQTQFS